MNAFIIGVDENKPYLVYLRDKKRPFAFAGTWDSIKDKTTGEEVYSFAIITTTVNPFIAKLGFKRMPVILFNEDESSRLRTSAQLSDLLSMLNSYPANLMNAFPIGDKINDKSLNEITLIQSIILQFPTCQGQFLL